LSWDQATDDLHCCPRDFLCFLAVTAVDYQHNPRWCILVL
jgi:hypothetical protein